MYIRLDPMRKHVVRWAVLTTIWSEMTPQDEEYLHSPFKSKSKANALKVRINRRAKEHVGKGTDYYFANARVVKLTFEVPT